LARRAAATAVFEALPGFMENMSSALEDPIYRPGEGASIRTLDGIRRRWAPYQVRLGSWKAVLDSRSQVLAEERDDLVQARRTWERTRAAAIEEGAPGRLLDRATATLGEIDDARARLDAQLEQVLSALDQVDQGQRSIEEILSDVGLAEAEARQRLFSPDSPTLWRAIAAQADIRTLAGEVLASWNQVRREWDIFFRTSSDQLAFLLGVFVIFLVLLRTLRRQVRAWGERDDRAASPEIEGTARVLDRPISAAVLLTALTWSLAYQIPSAAVRVFLMVTLVVPVWRLLPASIARDFRRPMYALVALWVFGELVTLAIDGSLVQRLSLLVTALLAVAGLYWAIRPESPIRGSAGDEWWQTTLLAGQVGIVIMGASVIANVMGFSGLAELLTLATIHIAVVALVLATVVTVLDGLISTFLHSDWAQRVRGIRSHRETLTARVLRLAHLGIFALWLGIVLAQFGIQRPVLDMLVSVLRADLSIGTVAISLGDLLAFAVVLWVSLTLARGIRVLLEEDVLRSLTLPRGVPAAISTLVHYAAVFIGFVMAAAAAGFDLSRFTLLAGAFGVGLGFGLQNVVNNFVSGLILIFERPIQVGDVVEVGGVQGHVRRIGIRASTVRTWSGAEVIVPNGDLISQQVTNWTLTDRLRRMEIPVGVRYGTDPQRVIDILNEAVRRHPEVLSDPEVHTLFQGFGESSLDFLVRAWTTSAEWMIVQSDLAVAMNQALKEADVEIPFPQRDLHLRSVDPEIELKG
ncbi:MAG: mechanosensitive ion channel domain-containing protein, partial [Longimicrobiales bacterium]